MSQAIRVTREYFLPDVDLKAALKLPSSTLILSVVRKQGYHKATSDTLDLQGCLVTVFDPKEVT